MVESLVLVEGIGYFPTPAVSHTILYVHICTCIYHRLGNFHVISCEAFWGAKFSLRPTVYEFVLHVRKEILRRMNTCVAYMATMCTREYNLPLWEGFSPVKPKSSRDRYVVAIEVTVGHLPWKRRYYQLLVKVFQRLLQGGLKIPCELVFSARSEEIKKLRQCQSWPRYSACIYIYI